MRLIADRLRRLRLGAEDGVVMIYALIAIVLVLASSAAALAAVNNDFGLGAADNSQKQAYAAAQAGIQRYLYALNQNSEYWTQCTANTNWIFNTKQPMTPIAVPGSSTETYAVMLLPANGYPKCDPNNPVNSMIQTSGNRAGTIRIASTGYAGTQKRTIVAGLRESSFLDYAWFTDYETSDPNLQVDTAYNQSVIQAARGGGRVVDTTIEPKNQCDASGDPPPCGVNYDAAVTGAQKQCSQWVYQGRYTDEVVNPSYGAGDFFEDSIPNGGGSQTNQYGCDSIEFIGNDSINGPFHTDDQAYICGSPTFGRDTDDTVQFGASPGTLPGCNAPSHANIQGNLAAPDNSIVPPPTNAALASIAGTTFTGTTCIRLISGLDGLGRGQYQWASPGQGANAANRSCFSSGLVWSSPTAYPANGVIAVKDDTCSLVYDVDDPSYTGNTGCGTVYVSGVTTQPLTITAAEDIVIDGNVTNGPSTALLGLIATNFVRVYHPVGSQPLGTNSTSCSTSTPNAPSSPTNITIDAMLLALQHSFVVDQYNCGDNDLGTLTINGGVAQKFRGPVGTNGRTGYIKNYTYDDRLRYEEPPHFIDPIQGAWRIQSQTECDTPTSCDASS